MCWIHISINNFRDHRKPGAIQQENHQNAPKMVRFDLNRAFGNLPISSVSQNHTVFAVHRHLMEIRTDEQSSKNKSEGENRKSIPVCNFQEVAGCHGLCLSPNFYGNEKKLARVVNNMIPFWGDGLEEQLGAKEAS
jgi:hypothetical protein